MNKMFTLTLTGLLVAGALTAQIQTKTYRLDISGGSFMGSLIPDYTKWYYFSFEKGDTIGSSVAVLENVNAGSIGSEVINAEWKARTDWDIAFHAADIRTNSGASGNGEAASLLIFPKEGETNADPARAYNSLNEAPAEGYAADEILAGSFIFGMTAMPPLRTAQLSASAAANGWAAVGMAGNVENLRVIVFKTATGKYAKVYLRQFFDGEGAPGNLVFDYAYQPNGSRTLTSTQSTQVEQALQPAALSVWQPAAGQVQIETANPSDPLSLRIYSLTGTLVRQAKGQAQLSVSGLHKGLYIIEATAGRNRLTQKIVVK